MSHELRTPLNAMLGFAQLLELDRRQPWSSTSRWAAQIQQAGWHLLEMINDMLDLSRIESGTCKLQPMPLDLAALVTAALAMVEPADAQARRASRAAIDWPRRTACAGRRHARQADPHQPAQQRRQVQLRRRAHPRRGPRAATPTRVEIAVTDTGMGMTPRADADLFQPFNRLGRERARSRRHGHRTGDQPAAGRADGRLAARAQRRRRRLDLHADTCRARPTATRCRPTRTTLPAPEADYHRRMVHYVEDNETNVEVMRGMLAQRPQVRLEVSMNGLDGLAAIRARQPGPDPAGHAPARHHRPGAAAPPEGRRRPAPTSR